MNTWFTRSALCRLVAVVAASLTVVLSSHAGTLVSNVWNTGVRSYPDPATPAPAPAGYSEMGVDYNSSGDLESAWYTSNSASVTTSAGDLRGTMGTSSLSLYSYFTTTASPVTLSNVGDELTLTWVFTPNGTMIPNTSQGFNVALVLTPSGFRNTADGSVQQANYTNGFAVFMNMATTFSNGNSFQLRKWGLAGSGALLGTSGNWTALTNDSNAVTGKAGFSIGTMYTFAFDMKLTAGGLQVVSSMSGGSIGGAGSVSDTYLDPSISTVSFDTFDIRPSGSNTGASQYDTSLFQVDFTAVPEPSTLVLVSAGLGLLIGVLRHRHS